MPDDREPPAEVVTEFRPPVQLTKAVARKDRIRFEIQLQDGVNGQRLLEELGDDFIFGFRDTGLPIPASVRAHKTDPFKLVVVYKPGSRKDWGEDILRIAKAFEDEGIPAAGGMLAGMVQALDALKDLRAQEQGSAVAAELA